jgi:hypothetical protein
MIVGGERVMVENSCPGLPADAILLVLSPNPCSQSLHRKTHQPLACFPPLLSATNFMSEPHLGQTGARSGAMTRSLSGGSGTGLSAAAPKSCPVIGVNVR